MKAEADRDIEEAGSGLPEIKTEQNRHQSMSNISGMTNSGSFADNLSTIPGFETGFDADYNDQTNYSVPSDQRFPD